MLIQEQPKSIVNQKNSNYSINRKCSYEEHLNVIKAELIVLFQKTHLAKDVKFLRKMAVNIKQLHYDAKIARKSEGLKLHAKRVERFLSTPIGAPFVGKITLTKAAETFGEQNPKESDLSILLTDFAQYGKHHPTHLLKVFVLSQRRKMKL